MDSSAVIQLVRFYASKNGLLIEDVVHICRPGENCFLPARQRSLWSVVMAKTVVDGVYETPGGIIFYVDPVSGDVSHEFGM